MLVPGFLPLFLPRAFPAGAEFTLAWASLKRHASDWTDHPVCHHPAHYPNTVTEPEASSLSLLPFFFIFFLASVFPSVRWGSLSLSCVFALLGGSNLANAKLFFI